MLSALTMLTTLTQEQKDEQFNHVKETMSPLLNEVAIAAKEANVDFTEKDRDDWLKTILDITNEASKEAYTQVYTEEELELLVAINNKHPWLNTKSMLFQKTISHLAKSQVDDFINRKLQELENQ